MRKIVLASHNKGKLKELSALLAPLGIEVTPTQASEPEENGTTFSENARLKARHSALTSGLFALSDDSGLVIPAIGDAPGIYSARWAGESKDFNIAFERIKTELQKAGAPLETPAYFVCVLSLCDAEGNCTDFEGRVYGTLTFPPRGDKGFGYDPIFIPDGYTQSFAEIAPEIKNTISHRASAFAKFMEYIGGLSAA
jgi:XTP/dITP diphosphohydrolase